MSDVIKYAICAICAIWSKREEAPPSIAARLCHLFALLKAIDPAFERWFYWPNDEGLISLDRPGLDIAKLIAANPSRNELGEPEPWWGYRCLVNNTQGDIGPTDFQIALKAGSRVNFNHLTMSTYHPASARYPIMKKALLAIAVAFQPEWCSAGPLDLIHLIDMSRYSRAPMPLSWMINLSPPIAPLVLPPTDIIYEYGGDSSLFMAATDEMFVTANAAHVAAARKIEAVVDPLNFSLPFDA